MDPEIKTHNPSDVDTSNYQLLSDDYFEEDETLDHATLFQDLKAGLEDMIAWERGEGERRVTILSDEGPTRGPEMMTRAQYDARLAELNAEKTADPTSDPYTLITQLLEWTGRKAVTADEAAQVSGLRRRAETLLKQAGVC